METPRHFLSSNPFMRLRQCGLWDWEPILLPAVFTLMFRADLPVPFSPAHSFLCTRDLPFNRLAFNRMFVCLGVASVVSWPIAYKEAGSLELRNPDAAFRRFSHDLAKTKINERSRQVVENKGNLFWVGVKAVRYLKMKDLLL
jgi:hypothetical protein